MKRKSSLKIQGLAKPGAEGDYYVLLAKVLLAKYRREDASR